MAVAMLSLTVGLVYVSAQWFQTGTIADSIFVSILLGATFLLLVGLHGVRGYLVRRGLDFYLFVFSTTDPAQAYERHHQLLCSVIHPRRMILSGSVYGLMVGTAPWLLQTWPESPTLLILLSLFLFFVNFATGMAFYALLMFFRHAVEMGRMLHIDLWQISNPSTSFLLGSSRRITLLASLYISMCLSSILFSVLPVGGLVVIYSIFAGIILLASLIIPPLPVAQKLRDAKAQVLYDLDQQLNQVFYGTLEKLKKGDRQSVDMAEFEALLQLREKIAGLNILPFKSKSITAGASIIFFSLIPVLLQFVLQKFFG